MPMQRLALLVLVSLLALSGAHAATFYKWVDEQGQVHYTDSPPEHVEYQVVTGAAPAGRDDDAPTTGERLEAWRAEQKERQAQREQQAAQRAEQERIAEARTENCANARERARILEQNTRILLPPREEGGEPVRMPDDERLAQLEEMRAAIREFCD